MLNRIRGKVVSVFSDGLEVQIGGIFFSVFVPPYLVREIRAGEDIELFVYSYMQQEGSRGFFNMIGFLSSVEREFFEMFITVSGIGPKAAIKALVHPVSEIAQWIHNGRQDLLCSLPGIGKQKAKQIIAKLQDKMAKFVLLKDGEKAIDYSASDIGREGVESIFDEAYQILLQLQYKKSEAKSIIEKAKRIISQPKSVEEVLEEIYHNKLA